MHSESENAPIETRPRVLAIIPAYNPGEALISVISGLEEFFRRENILVVNDGSDAGFFPEIPGGTPVLNHDYNRGKGVALRSGFDFALENGYDAVLTIDADMQHPPELAGNFLERMQNSGCDIVIGNRMSDLSRMPLQRRFSNRTTSFFVGLWTGRRIPDSQCGYRLIKSRILRGADLRVDRYQTETELILEAARLGGRFEFVDIPTIYNESESNISALRETLNYIALMVSHPFRKSRRSK